MDISKCGKGAIHIPDSRDYVFGAEATPVVDWATPRTIIYPTPIRDQGQSLSCVGQTTAELSDNVFKDTIHSARAVYSQIFLPGGGANLRDGMDVLSKQMIQSKVDVADWMDEVSMENKLGVVVTPDPNPLAYAVVVSDIDQVAAAIRDHGQVMLGVYGSNASWDTADPVFTTIVWGHAIRAFDFCMRNGKKAIVFQNSWSDQWGDKGCGYINEDYFKAGGVMASFVVTTNYVKPLAPVTGYKQAGSSSVYIRVGDSFVPIKSWDAWLALNGKNILPLPTGAYISPCIVSKQ